LQAERGELVVRVGVIYEPLKPSTNDDRGEDGATDLGLNCARHVHVVCAYARRKVSVLGTSENGGVEAAHKLPTEQLPTFASSPEPYIWLFRSTFKYKYVPRAYKPTMDFVGVS
jgi:hypothetical protein